MEEIKQLICTGCNTLKPINNFYKHKGCIDGYYKECKQCKSIKTKNFINQRKISGNFNLHIVEKKCAVCQIVKPRNEFGISNRTKTRMHSRCKSCRKIENINKEYSVSEIYSGVKIGAKKRKLDYPLKEEFITWYNNTKDICSYCDCTFEQFSANRNKIKTLDSLKRFREIFACSVHDKIGRLSIDRKNPSKGYLLDNIAKACWICNSLKRGIWKDTDIKELLIKVRKEIENAQ